MSKISIGDIELNVVDRGQGKVLLLVHGFPLDHSMWRHQIDGLADCCRVIAPDLRGFGDSDITDDVVTMEQLADDMALLLDALEITQPITFCGLSMGGYVAWQFWLRHASRLDSLIVCDTRAVADSDEAARGRLMAAERVLRDGPGSLVDGMLPKLFDPRTQQQDPDTIEATRQVMLGTNPRGIAAALRGMAQRIDATSLLSDIDVPTLVVCGESDVISPPDEMRDIAVALPNATFAQITGAGHMAPLEKSTAVNARIREFLGFGPSET